MPFAFFVLIGREEAPLKGVPYVSATRSRSSSRSSRTCSSCRCGS